MRRATSVAQVSSLRVLLSTRETVNNVRLSGWDFSNGVDSKRGGEDVLLLQRELIPYTIGSSHQAQRLQPCDSVAVPQDGPPVGEFVSQVSRSFV